MEIDALQTVITVATVATTILLIVLIACACIVLRLVHNQVSRIAVHADQLAEQTKKAETMLAQLGAMARDLDRRK